MGLHGEVHRLSRSGFSLNPFRGEGRAYFINWFGVGNGVSFSLVSLVSWVAGGGITGCSVPRGQTGGGRNATLSLV